MHAWAEIDLDNLEQNFRILDCTAGPHTALMPVIKSQAYGIGSEMAAKTLVRAGASMFAVSNMDEALFLRAKGISKPILNFGEATPKDYPNLVNNRIIQTIFAFTQLQSLETWAMKRRVQLPVHLKIDTGMGRLGFSSNQIDKLIKKVKQSSSLQFQGIYSHFPRATDTSLAYTRKQVQRFEWVIWQFKQAGICFRFKHVQNSAGILRVRTKSFNLARPGIALYGLEPGRFPKMAKGIGPVMSLKTRVVAIKDVNAHTPISYNHIYRTSKPGRIATLSIGYADGVSRLLSNRGRVLIKGRFYPIVGTVTMNFIMVDLGSDKQVKVGDPAVLIGKSGKKQIHMREVAEQAKTITYEIQCNVSAMVPRIYLRKGKAVAIRQNKLI